MLIRLCLIVAIVAGLAVGVLNFVQVKEKITTLRTDRDQQKSDKESAQTELASTKNDLEKTTTDLKQTKDALETTTGERDKAVADADDQRKKATALNDKLVQTIKERDDSQAELTQWAVLGVKPDGVRQIQSQNKQLEATRVRLEGQLTDLRRDYRGVTNELARYKPEWEPPVLPETVRGRVLVVDPKYDFVVLNVGEKLGAVEDGMLLVNRNGRLVAKVQIRSVQGERSIANVLPGWKLGEIEEGDEVMP